MLGNCKIIDLPKIADPRGNLTFIEGGAHIPFLSNAPTISTMCRAARARRPLA